MQLKAPKGSQDSTPDSVLKFYNTNELFALVRTGGGGLEKAFWVYWQLSSPLMIHIKEVVF